MSERSKKNASNKNNAVNKTIKTLNYKPIKVELDINKFKEDVFQWDDFNDEEELQKTDPFYNTKFTEKNIRKEFINLIDSADAKSELKGKKMKLFANKKTLPTKISLVKDCKNDKKKVKINLVI